MQEQPVVQTEQALPSRSEVHRKRKRKKVKKKKRYIFIRLLVLSFIALPIGMYYISEKRIEPKVITNFEEINFADEQKKNMYRSHTVREGETLQQIIEQYDLKGEGKNLILQYNHVSESEIRTGMVLKIPITSK